MIKSSSFFLFFLLILPAGLCFAQPGGDPGGGGNPTVPISGIEILIGAGGALGLKKMLGKRKNQSAD